VVDQFRRAASEQQSFQVGGRHRDRRLRHRLRVGPQYGDGGKQCVGVELFGLEFQRLLPFGTSAGDRIAEHSKAVRAAGGGHQVVDRRDFQRHPGPRQ
jgi:hypothetical protein